MKLNRFTYFIILVVLAIFYFSCLQGKKVYENFTDITNLAVKARASYKLNLEPCKLRKMAVEA